MNMYYDMLVNIEMLIIAHGKSIGLFNWPRINQTMQYDMNGMIWQCYFDECI